MASAVAVQRPDLYRATNPQVPITDVLGRLRDAVSMASTLDYGDPRDPKVDAVDWVELIPFSETRNYVQRIMENLQVYRARFGGGTKLQIEADLHRGARVE